MSNEEKLAMLKTLLSAEEDAPSDELLSTYLTMAKKEILNWLYVRSEVPEWVIEVPSKYEMVQIQACIAGFNMIGAEGQTWHSENGIARTFKYSDMLVYIHSHVQPYVLVG